MGKFRSHGTAEKAALSWDIREQLLLANLDKKEIDWVEERDGKLFGYECKWSPRKNVMAPKLWKETYSKAEFEIITPENFLDFVL